MLSVFSVPLVLAIFRPSENELCTVVPEISASPVRLVNSMPFSPMALPLPVTVELVRLKFVTLDPLMPSSPLPETVIWSSDTPFVLVSRYADRRWCSE